MKKISEWIEELDPQTKERVLANVRQRYSDNKPDPTMTHTSFENLMGQRTESMINMLLWCVDVNDEPEVWKEVFKPYVS